MRRRQRGIAVITALLLMTLALTIVASLFWEQQVQVRAIENQRMQLQKQWILRGALDWASLILREDAKHSGTDHLGEPWATPLAETRLDQYVEEGRPGGVASDTALSGGISDAQARYNLANLSGNGRIDQAEVAAFARLLEHTGINPAHAQAVADALAAAQPGDGNGAQTEGGNNQSSGKALQPMRLAQLDDLLAVPGFTPEMLGRLQDWVIILPRPTPVNVNTAPAQVLAARFDALSLEEATLLVAMRKSASFRDLADFTHRLPGKILAASASHASVTTQYFLVNGKVRMGHAALDVRALVERDGGITRVVWIREY
jgi:general secretion pathway protein K